MCFLVFSASVIERAIAKGCSVSPSVCHTRDAIFKLVEVRLVLCDADRKEYMIYGGILRDYGERVH